MSDPEALRQKEQLDKATKLADKLASMREKKFEPEFLARLQKDDPILFNNFLEYEMIGHKAEANLLLKEMDAAADQYESQQIEE